MPAMHHPPRPLIRIASATFHRTPGSPALFPGLTFTLPPLAPAPATTQKWTVLGPGKSALLSVLSGTHTPRAPHSRTYPALAARGKWPQSAIGLVSFGAGSAGTGMLAGGAGGGGYAASRYESLRGEFDLTLRAWLAASVDLGRNPHEDARAQPAEEEAERAALVGAVAGELQLEALLGQSVMTLSNGQSRRAAIAQALLRRPEVLLVDEPFMGLDPVARRKISALLDGVSRPGAPFAAQVVCGLRLQDAVPAWSTHLAYVADNRVLAIGEKRAVVEEMAGKGLRIRQEGEKGHGGLLEKVWAGADVEHGAKAREPEPEKKEPEKEEEEEEEADLPAALVEMKNVKIAYYGNEILSDFSWTIRRGEKWGLFGPNGSGKTTLISLLTSEHPLTYSLPIRHFGQPRLPTRGTPGISVFDIQRRIGHASPEVHAFFPKHLSLRRAVLSGFAEAFLAAPRLTAAQAASTARLLARFDDVVAGSGGGGGWDAAFGEAALGVQRLALFLRAVAPRRELLVLDEALSGMDAGVRDRCLALLEEGGGWWEEGMAMVVVSHVGEEVPRGVRRWVRLAERGSGRKAVFGVVE